MSKDKRSGKDKYARYKAAQKREKSHVSKIRAHIALHPDDEQARNALKVWERKLK